MPSKRKAEPKAKEAASKKGKVEAPTPEPVVEERVTRKRAAEAPAAAVPVKETKKAAESKAKKAPEPSPQKTDPTVSKVVAKEKPASKSKKAAVSASTPALAPAVAVAAPTLIIPKPVISDKKASGSRKGAGVAVHASSKGEESTAMMAAAAAHSDIKTVWKQIWVPLNFALNTLFPIYTMVLFFCYSFPQYSPLPAISKDDAFTLFGLALSYTGVILMASFVLVLVPFVLLSRGSFAVRFILAAAFAFMAAKKYIKL